MVEVRFLRGDGAWSHYSLQEYIEFLKRAYRIGILNLHAHGGQAIEYYSKDGYDKYRSHHVKLTEDERELLNGAVVKRYKNGTVKF